MLLFFFHFCSDIFTNVGHRLLTVDTDMQNSRTQNLITVKSKKTWGVTSRIFNQKDGHWGLWLVFYVSWHQPKWMSGIPSWRLSAFVQKHCSPLATRQYRNRYSVRNLVSNYLQIRSKIDRFLEIISCSHECSATQPTSQNILKQQQTIMSNLIPHRIWYQGKWISDDLW